MPTDPLETFDCTVTLPDWRLHLAQMTNYNWRDLGNVMDLATEGAMAELLRNHPDGRLESGKTTSAIRDSMISLGFNLDETPLCSDQLLSELLDKKNFPRGCLAWEFLAILTIKSQAPWAVLDEDKIRHPLTFRLGESGETVPTLTGVMDCEGLPVLADSEGAKASPWNQISRYSLEGVSRPLYICFLPKELFRKVQPKTHIGRTVWLTWAFSFEFEKTCTCKEPG